MQPNVHAGRVVRVAGVIELLREFFSRRQAAIHANQLHEIHDRSAPVELLRIFLRHVIQHGLTSTGGAAAAGLAGAAAEVDAAGAAGAVACVTAG